MQNAKLTWNDPSGPLTGVEISMRVAGAPDFTVLDVVAPGIQTLSVPDLVDGDYEFRAVSLNKTRRSAGVTTAGSVVSTPGDVSALAVTFS